MKKIRCKKCGIVKNKEKVGFIFRDTGYCSFCFRFKNMKKFTKISEDTFRRVMDIEKEDVFNKSLLENKRDDLTNKITLLQKELDEVNDILKEIKKVE